MAREIKPFEAAKEMELEWLKTPFNEITLFGKRAWHTIRDLFARIEELELEAARAVALDDLRRGDQARIAELEREAADNTKSLEAERENWRAIVRTLVAALEGNWHDVECELPKDGLDYIVQFHCGCNARLLEQYHAK